jgi:hypothetical protein
LQSNLAGLYLPADRFSRHGTIFAERISHFEKYIQVQFYLFKSILADNFGPSAYLTEDSYGLFCYNARIN